ncbi:MAG TPA: hypothetical protein VL992_00045, partial [Tepidisphaeraceae bacterium]|nr:hypothetical protein [Tepidisphaeraceae bacterium]
MHFASVFTLALAAILGACAVLVAMGRRLRLHPIAAISFLLGILLLAIAAGEPYWLTPGINSIAVMVDLSPGTRGAAFRDSGLLHQRIGELLGKRPFQLVDFDDQFTPAPADAIVLFSGGRFPSPAASPPIYPVLDPSLENAVDAAITGLELRGKQVFVSVTNNGPPRTLTLHGVLGPATQTVQSDETLTATVDPAADTVWAELSGGDLWPENDRASIRVLPPVNSQRWWIGQVAPDGWQAIAPDAIPTDAGQYLAPSVIVLDNVSADQIPAAGMDRLEEYVRDLGGSLLVLGGDRAFGSGGYVGTEL